MDTYPFHHNMEPDHDWEQIHSPFSANLIDDEDADNNNNDEDHNKGSLIVFKDEFFGKPSSTNHEDLHNEPEPLDPPPRSENGSAKSASTKLAVVFEIADRLRKSIGYKLEYLSLNAWMAAGGSVAAVLMVLWLRRRVLAWRQRQARLESCNRKLVFAVREKDKRIDDLLHQIVRMNEVLFARRRVPVVRVQ